MNKQNFSVVGELNHIIKSFGDVVALSDISFTIERGGIIGFLGPNGSGKTTSIQLLLGLSRPQSGEVQLFGQDPFDNSKLNRLIGYISEEGVFPKWITAYQFLNSLAQFNMPPDIAEKRAKIVLEEVELEHVADKRIRKFSKGMRQRMKIAQALLHKPALVIADEPFNGLDPKVRAHMFDLFRKYNREYNTTFFISSHILFEVERLANKIILIYKGRTIAQGSPQRIREMITDLPHNINIVSSESRNIAKLLVENFDEEIVRSIEFQKETNGNVNLKILTHQPKQFYEAFTDLVVNNSLPIKEIKAKDEGLETLFRSLTEG